MTIKNAIGCATAIGIVIGLSGCGGGGTASSGVSLAGTVTAPGGTIAFNQPTGLKSMFAKLFMSQAHAAVSGMFPVGAGVTINLIEIDNTGAQVGAVLATATTNVSGTYTLTAPAGFTAASKYVVRAVGTGGNQLDAMVTGTTVDVDPGSNVTKTLVLAAVAGGSLANLTPAAVIEVQDQVDSMAKDSAAAFNTLAEANAGLTAQMQSSEEASNIVSSTVSSGVLTGTVTDSSNVRLPNIRIVVRDFGNWVTRAVARTDANGVYIVNVPAGNYILGAINRTATSTAASEWWTTGGGAINQFSAEQVTVGGAVVTRDFVLDPGARISGTVTAESGGAALEGIKILIRDFTIDEPASAVHTGSDGTFRINLRPGTYTVGAYNSTRQPYAMELYNPTLNGGVNATQATPITLAAGASTTTDFSLLAGNKIAGTVSDPTSGIAKGISVRFFASTDAFVQGNRTDNLGQYQLWLRPSTYTVRSRGQTVTADISAGSLTGQNFAAAVGQITATLSGPSGAVSQAKVRVYDTSANFQSFEVSNADGTVTLFSTVNPARVEFKIDNGSAIGSALYNATGVVTQFSLAGNIAVNVGGAATALGNVTLGAGGVLSGTVTVATVPTADRVVQVRSGGTATPANQFVAGRTQSDGTYSVSLPEGTYQVRACIPGACVGAFSSITIAAGSNTRNFAL